MKKRVSIFCLLGFILSVLPLQAQQPDPWAERDTFIFGMPYIGHAVQPRNTGMISDILKAVFEPEDIDFAHVPHPYKRVLEELRAGTIHCSLQVKDHYKGVLQGETTLATYDLSAAYLYKTGFGGVQSLAGKKIAFLHGFGIQSFIPVTFRAQPVYDLSSAFHMLDRGHVDYVLGDGRLLRDAIDDSDLPSGEFVISGISSFEVRPIFAPTKDGRRFRAIYDRRMKELIASGKLVAIMEKHGLGKESINRVLQAN